MATRFEIWKQAVLDLERAEAELDQVHASLKDIGLQNLGSDAGAWATTVPKLVAQATRLLIELRNADCPECDHLISRHGDKYGCEHERGDVSMSTRGAGTVLAAAGPCHCRWGLEEPAGRHS
jgi:hypothetical protein